MCSIWLHDAGVRGRQVFRKMVSRNFPNHSPSHHLFFWVEVVCICTSSMMSAVCRIPRNPSSDADVMSLMWGGAAYHQISGGISGGISCLLSCCHDWPCCCRCCCCLQLGPQVCTLLTIIGLYGGRQQLCWEQLRLTLAPPTTTSDLGCAGCWHKPS